jgi:ABC-type glycerol-3-phosphate transport system substrate-binding protein
MSILRKFLSVLVLCTIFSVLFSSFTFGEEVVVTYWEKWVGRDIDAVKVMVDAFNKRYTGKIRVEVLSTTNINEKTLTAIAGGNPPDVAGIWPEDIPQFAIQGAVVPLDDFIKEAKINKADYYPGTWSYFEYRGHIWGLPSTNRTPALYYNADLFKEVGLNPDRPPKTLEELDKYNDKLTKIGPKGEIIRMGYIPWYRYPGPWGLGRIFGGEDFDPEKNKWILDEGYEKAFSWALTYAKKFGYKNILDFQASFGATAGADEPFLMNRVAIEYDTPFRIGWIKLYKPKLSLRLYPSYPQVPGGPTNYCFQYADALIIPKNAKHPKEAWEFIKYYNSREGQLLMNIGSSQLPVLKELANSSDFLKKSTLAPYTKVFVTTMNQKKVITTPKSPNERKFETWINDAFQEVLYERKSPKDALDELRTKLQNDLDELLARFK